MIPSPTHLLRQLRRARAVRLDQASQDDLASRPLHKLDPTGRLNQTLDTDLYTAQAHPGLSVVVPAVDVLAEVTRRIDDLYTSGSLDYGSFTVLDEFLETWGVNMVDAAAAHTQSQLDYLNRAALMEARTVQETWDALQQAQAELEDAEDARIAARSVLTGTPARPRSTSNTVPLAPVTAPAPGTAQEFHTRALRAPARQPAGQPVENVDHTQDTPPVETQNDEGVVEAGADQPSSPGFPLRAAEQDTEEREEGVA